ncbi:hypothetical protein ALP41_01104 [Pseudomonas savastanoi pv. nerii]|nr:hypothetical protein [Pseudomonas savastanoi]RMT74796.1 hypothetical protein ALP41_01104 [Pseudomonas savastanoi pv. nerii]
MPHYAMIAIPRCLAVKIKRWIFLHTPDGKTSDAMPERKPEHSEFILTKSWSSRLDFFLHGNPNETRRDEIAAIAKGRTPLNEKLKA